MKKIILLTMSLTAVFLLATSFIIAAGNSISIGGTIGVEDFNPIVWQCGDRMLWDEEIQPWRVSGDDEELFERNANYIFTGERYQVDVVVFDKNKIQDVVVDLTLNGVQNDYEVNCVPIDSRQVVFADCNARIDEESITRFDSTTMKAYQCTLTAPLITGEYTMSVEAERDSVSGSIDEFARWFFNPSISVSLGGSSLNFGSNIRPGTSSYSNTVQLTNTGEGGVVLDLFITGKDWQPTSGNLGRCLHPTTGQYVNYLPLEAFSYYAENGAYSTRDDEETDNNNYNPALTRDSDVEGYVNINPLLNQGFEENMFDEAEVIQAGGDVFGTEGYRANLLYSGTTGVSMTFRLNLPEPCYGSFESGSGGFTIWAEAV